MPILQTISCVEEIVASRGVNANGRASTIRCYTYQLITTAPAKSLSPDRRLTAQAMGLLMRLDGQLREARADWNQDRFRRLMRLRPKALTRLRRRWLKLKPPPRIPLGTLRRRYHANLAGHLYKP